MPNIYDILYGAGVTISAPVWLLRGRTRRKVFSAFRNRMGHVDARPGTEPLILIHAVSLGEINATRKLVDELSKRRPDLYFVVSSTTETGFKQGLSLYRNMPRVKVVRYPLDFSTAVRRLLDRVRPSLAVLMELEVWPNFIAQCEQRDIPVVLVNGRLTEGSYRNYLRAAPFTRPMFSRLSAVCVQEKVYADRFTHLGARKDRVKVTGTMKFDTALVADRIDGDEELAESLGLKPGEPLWVCGSTGPGEEAIVLDVYRQLLQKHPALRLAIIPRKPERFDEVAALIKESGFELVRRSEVAGGKVGFVSHKAVILGDTMGELRKFYSLAAAVFVGRTLVDLGKKQHGSDMIEPCALAKPVVVGPYTTNFAEVMNAFREHKAIAEASNAEELLRTIETWLANPSAARDMAQRSQEIVKRQRGATQRHIDAILQFLPAKP
jgi:3-deoxy-D-manno-octulosonic-acid transferase